MGFPILVTGGGGFIGSHLVRRLLAEGERVRILERPGASVGHLGHYGGVEIMRGDVRDRATVAKAVQGCLEVYHLAANPQLWAWPRGQYRQINFQGTIHVLEEAWKAGVRRILHTSTECILSRDKAGQDRLGPILGPYQRSKNLAERFALGLARQGAPIVIVNPTCPIGPGDYSQSPPTQMVIDFCQGHRREYVDGQLNLIDVRDVAEGMIQATRHGTRGRRYILGHENMSLREVFARLARLTGIPEPTRRIPYTVALAAAYVSEWVADVFTHRPPLASVTGVKLTRRPLPPNPGADLAQLGIVPRPIAGAFRDAIGFCRQMGWLKKAA